MRLLTFALAALVLHAMPARAEADDDEDEDGYVRFPARQVGVLVTGHGTRIGGISESGFGVSLDAALGRGRWQYLVEGGLATTGMNDWTRSAYDMRIDGRVARGALGLRWLARQFRPDSSGGVELLLISTLGMQRFDFEDDTQLTRPELALGLAVQGRIYERPRLAFRLEARVLFTPNDGESSLVACRGRCMDGAGSSTGFRAGIGFAW